MRHFFLLLSALVALALLAVSAPVLAQGTTPPRVIFQANVPGISLNKYPDIATAGRTVHIASNSQRLNAVYVQKGDNAQTFSTPEVLGAAPGQADFSPATIATGGDGSVHFAWLDQTTRRISYRSRPNNGPWGPTRTVTTSSGFPASVNIGVASDGAIFVSWRVADAPFRVRRSTNGGQTWSNDFVLGNRAGVNFGYIATGPSGQTAVTFTSAEGDLLQIFVALWTGSGFNIQRVTPLNGFYADPSATYDAAGNLTIGLRGIEDGPTSGVWVATPQSGDQWQVTRLASGNIKDMVNLQADTQNNLHLVWISDVSGENALFYSFRPSGGEFTAPIRAPSSGGAIFNSRMAPNIGDEAYAHAVSELFAGSGSNLRYFLLAARSLPPVGAQPVIEDGEEISEKEPAVAVRFDNVQGAPTQIRWNWDSAPTDADNDSSGWVPFTNPMTIPLPESILANTPCSAEKLFTQVREADNDTSPVQSDDIVIDTGISGAITIGNPYSRKAGEFTPARATLGDVGTSGASDGDPGYTRDPIFYVELRGVNECSGLKDLAAGRSATTTPRAFGVSNEVFANVLPYPGRMADGSNELLVRVSDKAGNIADYPRTLILDRAKPVLGTGGSLAATANPKATILTKLTVTGASVTDNAYPGRAFWGIWVANSRTQVANPATDPSLFWVPMQAPGTGGSFEINNWSLATGLGGTIQPGTYHIYVRFLDGAGNATDGHLTASVTLAEVTRPKVSLPAVRR